MKKPKHAVFIIGVALATTLVMTSLVYLAIHYVSENYLDHAAIKVRACSGQHPTHEVTIRNNMVAPNHTVATICDNLKITNLDSRLRRVAFGEHDHHQLYDGVSEKVLLQNQSFTVVLNKAGTYKFHDHLWEETTGDFIVNGSP